MSARSVCAALLWVVLFVAACTPSAGDPRGTVIKFLRAVRSADTLVILRSLTVEAPYTIVPDTGLADTGARRDTVMVARLLRELLPGGALNARWSENRMVVGDVEMRGDDSALVELTRLDQTKGAQVYNKVGVVNHGGYWQIYSFHTQDGPSL